MKNLKIVLLWDAYYRAHLEANLAFLKTLLLENEEVIVLTCSTYYQEKHAILSHVAFDQETGQSRFSRRKRVYRSLRRAIDQITELSHASLPILLRNHPQIKFISAYDLVTKDDFNAIRKNTRSLGLSSILEAESYGIKLAPHWSVDLSLDCKTLLDDIISNTPPETVLRSLAFHSFLALEALHCLCNKQGNEPMQFISTSVYSLDWICRQYILNKGSRHVFVQMLSRDPKPFAKVYKSVPEDLFLRRQVQAYHAGCNALLLPSIEYAEKYISARLASSSSHTYSPLKSEVGVLAEILAGSQVDSGKPLWVYYTNSPDELVSIAHAYHSSGISGLIPWADTGFIRNEVEALTIIIELAHSMNVSLVVRQHPRLWCEQRSQFVSSTYESLSTLLRKHQVRCPGVVTIIEPWEPVNSYELAILSDKVISFRGTMPLEVSLLGIKPIVLARDQGIMNYWIRDHAEAAPKTLEELEQLLYGNSTNRFSLAEICSYLIQFYLLNQYGTVKLDCDVISAKSLSSALRNDSSIFGTGDRSLAPSGPSYAEAEQMVDSYFQRLYDKLVTCFL